MSYFSFKELFFTAPFCFEILHIRDDSIRGKQNKVNEKKKQKKRWMTKNRKIGIKSTKKRSKRKDG